jgi:hypothetical protein
VILEVVLPLLANSIEALLNPYDQKSVSILSQIILQILDFDPTPHQLSPLFHEIVLKFERASELTPVSPLHLKNLLESLKIASQFLSPRKVSHLAWKYLHEHRSILLQSLNDGANLSMHDQTSAYNMVVLILQTLQACAPLRVNDPLDDSVALFTTMRSLVLEQLEPRFEDPAKHLSLLQFRRSSLVMFLSHSAVK